MNKINKMKKVEFSTPIVKNYGGDMSKKWHIYYRVFNPITGEMNTIRDYEGLHPIKDFTTRMEAANKKCDIINQKLISGWRPFNIVFIENKLAYSYENVFRKSYLINNSVEAVSSEFLAEKKIPASMYDEYRSKFRGFLNWLRAENLSDIQIALIDNKSIVRFFEFLIKKLDLSSNTYKKYRQALMALWDFAIEKKYVTINVVINLPHCDTEKDEAARPIRNDDLIKLFDMLKYDPQLELACKFELFCLMRPGKEVRFLRIGMIDFNRSIINLPADIVKNTNPKRKRAKTVTIPEYFLQELKEKYELQSYPKDYFVFGKNGIPGVDYIGKNTLRTRFRNLRASLRLPENYKLYSMKHTGVTAMMDQNFHPNEISQQAGWSTVYMLEVYAKHKQQRENENIRKNFNPLKEKGLPETGQP